MLADRVVPRLPSIRNYERGDQEPHLSTLRRIAAALGVTMDGIALVDAKTTAVVAEAPPGGSPEGWSNDAMEGGGDGEE